jgi:TolB-like protein
MSEGSKAVFLSYASQDAEAALRLCLALRAAGVEVWFDQSELRGGDSWDAKIRKQIKECALFVPIISENTEDRGEGYFRLEWKLAEERTHLIATGVPFLVPVALGPVRERDALVPDRFREVQWSRVENGESITRLVEQVKRLLGAPRHHARPLSTPGGNTTSPGLGGTHRAHRRPPRLLWAGLIGVVIVGLALWNWRQRLTGGLPTKTPARDVRSPLSAPAVSSEKSVAVLPFANLSEEKEAMAFFADGVHDDILTNLTNVRELRVISRTTMMRYRDTKKSVPEIAAELGVNYIMEGTVRRAGAKVRVSGQLIEARTDRHLWARNYDKELTDIFAIQSGIAQEIAAALHAAILPDEKLLIERRPTTSPAAYDLFLKASGRGLALSSNQQRQTTLLQAAVQIDPNFAIAWSKLGTNFLNEYIRNGDPALLARGNHAIEMSVRLAPTDIDVLIGVAERSMKVRNDYRAAEEQLQRVAGIAPNHPRVHERLADLYEREGRWQAALEEYRIEMRLDPDNLQGARFLVGLLDATKRYEEAAVAQQWVVALATNEREVEAFYAAWISFRAAGSTRHAEEFFGRLSTETANSPSGRRLRRRYAAFLGRQDLDDVAPASGEAAIGTSVRHAMWSALDNDDSLVALAARHDRAGLESKRADVARYRSAVETSNNLFEWGELAKKEALLGNSAAALDCINRALQLSQPGGRLFQTRMKVILAFVHAWSGDKETALVEYGELLRVPFSGLNVHEMKRDLRYQPLQGDPRFQALLNDPKNNAPLF